MQVQTSDLIIFQILVYGHLDFLRNMFITSTTGLISSELELCVFKTVYSGVVCFTFSHILVLLSPLPSFVKIVCFAYSLFVSLWPKCV